MGKSAYCIFPKEGVFPDLLKVLILWEGVFDSIFSKFQKLRKNTNRFFFFPSAYFLPLESFHARNGSYIQEALSSFQVFFSYLPIRIFFSSKFPFPDFIDGPAGRALRRTKGILDFFRSFFWHQVASCAHSDSVHPSGLASPPSGGRIIGDNTPQVMFFRFC